MSNPKAQFGRFKEKRSDCRLVTLGLVIDGNGFPKCSRIFSGNQSEPKTLLQMVKTLSKTTTGVYGSLIRAEQTSLEKPTVVIDTGIASEANLAELVAAGYHYICVSCSKPELHCFDDYVLVKELPA